MGQTLTHGVYLPDEGERNCYSGLAANWQILDGSVGTIAAHTAALAGKAPLVHTHGNITNDGKVGTAANVPLITGIDGVVQAGSFGNAANTFCEGNDSRLSDARTPVAHTHTKSDVTDLLNSNFIPSANNSYDLGSSSYQWNNLYAKNYYYNGVAWGLDKANVWTQTNYFTKDLIINSEVAANTQSALSGNKIRQIVFNDSNNSNYFFRFRQYVDASSSRMQFNAQGFDSNNQAYSATFVYRINSDGSSVLYPGDNNQSLGTSTSKWKSFNGVNPGALSLPNIYDSYDVVTTNWSTAYNQPNDLKINGANPSYPGWLFIKLDNCTAADDFIIVRYYHVNATNLTFFGSFIPTASSYVLSVPIQAGITTKVWVSKLPTYCKYYACLGTVK